MYQKGLNGCIPDPSDACSAASALRPNLARQAVEPSPQTSRSAARAGANLQEDAAHCNLFSLIESLASVVAYCICTILGHIHQTVQSIFHFNAISLLATLCFTSRAPRSTAPHHPGLGRCARGAPRSWPRSSQRPGRPRWLGCAAATRAWLIDRSPKTLQRETYAQISRW